MKTLREIIIERLIHNRKASSPTDQEMNDYVLELESHTDYDLLDEFELMLTETQ